MENLPKSYEETSREVALEANQLHGKIAPPEEIGRFLISTETDPADNQNREAAINKRVETMSHSELLDVSDKITVEGTSLKKIYETHLIGERGLRRLTGEYLRTGDIRDLLRHELMQHEIDFERDPQLRDRIKREINASGSSAPLNALLQQAGVVEGDEKGEAVMLKERLLNPNRQKLQPHQSFHRSKFLDIAFISIILILLLLVIVLLIGRL